VTDDLAPFFEGWDFTPNDLNARKIIGLDGKPKLQMRLELGLIQMEWNGRPDGKRPHGSESVLDHLRQQARVHELTHPPDEPFSLDDSDCAALQHEGIQYYYRYLCMFHLGENHEAERDTERNLQVFGFVRKYAADQEWAWAFEQYRPYVTMMNARAKVSICLESQNYAAALRHLEAGIGALQRFLKEHPSLSEDECSELAYLRGWQEEVQQLRRIPPFGERTEEGRLESELEEAVATENFEQAARIRDALKRLHGE
jgi:hypothetical protein